MPNDKDQTADPQRVLARQSTKNELATRRRTQRERLQSFWDDSFDLLEEYARERIPDSYESDAQVSDYLTALEHVRKKLRRCKAQTQAGFIAWAVRMLAKETGFHLATGAIKKFDLEVSDWIDNAQLRLYRYADFPKYEKDGSLYRIHMGTRDDGSPIVWTVPEQWWGFVQKLWPVKIKRQVGGSDFIVKQVSGQTIPAHRLIFNCKPGDTVQSSSGNLLDWTSLCVRPFNLSGIYAGRNTSWNKDERRPNSAQEEFERRFEAPAVLENYGVTPHGERFLIFDMPRPLSAI